MSDTKFVSSTKKKKYDRFIPTSVSRQLFNSDSKRPAKNGYEELLGERLFPNVPKILRFGDENEVEKENSNPNVDKFNKKNQKNEKNRVKMPMQPYKVLPAASLKDDFYLNLVDYGDSNHIAVGLQSSLYLWSGCATKVQKVY